MCCAQTERVPDVFLTGATGFIGGALLDRLTTDGRSVLALVRSEPASPRLDRTSVDTVIGDITDEDGLSAAMAGCATVFHVAGLNAMCLRDRSALEHVNVDGTMTVIRAAARAGVDRVVYTSSAASIGEPRGTVGIESTVHRGSYITSYERSKHLAELAAFHEAALAGVELVAINPSSVQGPGRAGGTARILLAYLRGRLRFAIDTRMDLVFIDDVVDAHLLAESSGAPGHRYLVSGWTTTVAEAIVMLTTVTGQEHRVRYFPSPLLFGAGWVIGAWCRLILRDAPFCLEMVRMLRHGHAYDGSLIEREWGFSYTPPEEWLARTVEWYRSSGLL